MRARAKETHRGVINKHREALGTVGRGRGERGARIKARQRRKSRSCYLVVATSLVDIIYDAIHRMTARRLARFRVFHLRLYHANISRRNYDSWLYAADRECILHLRARQPRAFEICLCCTKIVFHVIKGLRIKRANINYECRFITPHFYRAKIKFN